MIDNIYLFFLNRTIMWRTTAKASYMKPIIELVFDFEKKTKKQNKTKTTNFTSFVARHTGPLSGTFFWASLKITASSDNANDSSISHTMAHLLKIIICLAFLAICFAREYFFVAWFDHCFWFSLPFSWNRENHNCVPWSFWLVHFQPQSPFC